VSVEVAEHGVDHALVGGREVAGVHRAQAAFVLAALEQGGLLLVGLFVLVQSEPVRPVRMATSRRGFR
jgi:hypothetical protein